MIASPEGIVAAEVRELLAAAPDRLLVIGICGAQGSGKSTMVKRLQQQFAGSAILSLDDLYLTRAQRQRLAGSVHPLLVTRGVPGTHDVALGLEVLDALARGASTRLPRFDKARDDRVPADQWPAAPSPCNIVFLEGWCLGAAPQADAELVSPVNELEAREDPDGAWRNFVNHQLKGSYLELFARVDFQVFLAAPDFNTVYGWRRQQEAALRLSQSSDIGVMDDVQLARFIAHYERLTRHLLGTMPDQADLVIRLDSKRRCIGTVRGAQGK